METEDPVPALKPTQEHSQIEKERKTPSENFQPSESEKKTAEITDITSSANQNYSVEPPEKKSPSTGKNTAEEKSSDKEKSHDCEGKEKVDQPSDGRKSSENDPNRKRRHDDRDRHHKYEERHAPSPEEPEEDFDESLVVLDKYNSDLNMKLHSNRLIGQTLSLEGFAYTWGGTKATHGVKSGKVCYECKLTEEHSVRHLSSAEPNRHLVRLGWSSGRTGLQLGEEELSFAYCGTGKAVANKTVIDYGEAFKEGDIIGCYLDFTGENNITMIFIKNGVSLGVAFTIEKEKLAGVALFPHVLCKNMTVEMNFGQKEEPFFAPPDDLKEYVFLASLPAEERVRGVLGAHTRKECEVLMLVGLPGAGKTHWVKHHVAENPGKNYCILESSAIIDKMRVSGLENKAQYELLVARASNCINKLMQVACKTKRNFILDQTNVRSSTQRRTMHCFEGYQRKAIVIVSSDEEFKDRVEKRIKEDGNGVSHAAMYELKANFSIPEVGDLFEEIIFPELNKEDATKLVEKYREEAKTKGPAPEKRLRGGFKGSHVLPGRSRLDNLMMGARPPLRGSSNFGRFGDHRSIGNCFSNGGDWNQNRNFTGDRGILRPSSRGGYGGCRYASVRNNQKKNVGTNNRNRQTVGGESQQSGDYDNNQDHQNRTTDQKGGVMTSSPTTFQHIAYQQHVAQFSSKANQTSLFQQYHQSDNPQVQPDHSQQWAQCYQQQATVQQQQAPTVHGQYQNYYASYQTVYGSQV